MSVIQRTLDFDLATLNRCINDLQPRRLRTLFRGLLMAAANEPRLVTDIDSEGFVLMSASIEKIASWSGVDVRTIQRCRKALSDFVDQDGGTNSTSLWSFSLRNIMPESAIGWFINLVEESRLTEQPLPRHLANAAPAFGVTHPGICHPGVSNAAPAFQNHTSIWLKKAIASLAGLAQVLKGLGVAFTGESDWSTLQLDDGNLAKPEVVAALADVFASNESERLRVFIAAVVAQSATRSTAWNYFKWLVENGHFLTTKETKQQRRTAETMLRFTNGTDAAQIVPMTGDEAWAKVLAGMRRWDYMHQITELKAEVGLEIYNAVRASGGFGKIARTDANFQRDNRQAFLDAWHAQQTVSAAMQ